MKKLLLMAMLIMLFAFGSFVFADYGEIQVSGNYYRVNADVTVAKIIKYADTGNIFIKFSSGRMGYIAGNLKDLYALLLLAYTNGTPLRYIIELNGTNNPTVLENGGTAVEACPVHLIEFTK